MKRLGNACVNAFLEFKLPANQKLSSDAQSSARSDFIRTKYVDRKWAADSADFCADFQKLGMPDPQQNKAEDTNSMIDVQKYFFQNVQEENFGGVLACIMAGADPNVLIDERSVLDVAVEKRSILTTEYLLLNGAKERFKTEVAFCGNLIFL